MRMNAYWGLEIAEGELYTTTSKLLGVGERERERVREWGKEREIT